MKDVINAFVKIRNLMNIELEVFMEYLIQFSL